MLTRHFSLEEFTSSTVAANKGIDNAPPPNVLQNLRLMAQRLETVRSLLVQPIVITSGYRSQRLNAAVGGAPTSAHLTGWAADFVAPKFGSPYRCATAIAKSGIKFDQLILEYGWVHISFDPRMRGQCLTKRSASAPYGLGLNP